MAGSEDYLDGLLNSVTKKLSEIDEASGSKKDTYLPPKTNKALNQMREDQFLKEFEADLELGEGDDFLSEFEKNLDSQEEKKSDDPLENFDIGSLPDEPIELMDMDEEDASFSDAFLDEADGSGFDGLSDMPVSADPASDSHVEEEYKIDLSAPMGMTEAAEAEKEPVTESASAEPVMGDVQLGELPIADEEEAIIDESSLDEAVQQPVDDAPEGMKDLASLFDADGTKDASVDDEQIIDESKLDEAVDSVQLEDSEDAELAEIGKMLNSDNQEFQIDENNLADPDSFAQAESVTKAKSENEKNEKSKKEKKPGGGFLSKFLSFMFGEDDEEGADGADVNSPEALAKETDQVLNDMAGEDAEAADDKKKKKKEKKEKPKKEPKPKKEKPPKPPKPSKPPKAPKERDPHDRPLPKLPVVLIFIIAASLFALIFLGTNIISRSNHVNFAKESFDKGNYRKAYQELATIQRNEEEEALYNKAKTLAVVSAELDAYYALVSVKKYDLAIDCLIRGLGRCDIENARAEEWGCVAQMNALKKEIEKQLMDQYSMTPEQAMEIYALEDRDDYSIAIHRVLEALGLRYN